MPLFFSWRKRWERKREDKKLWKLQALFFPYAAEKKNLFHPRLLLLLQKWVNSHDRPSSKRREKRDLNARQFSVTLFFTFFVHDVLGNRERSLWAVGKRRRHIQWRLEEARAKMHCYHCTALLPHFLLQYGIWQVVFFKKKTLFTQVFYCCRKGFPSSRSDLNYNLLGENAWLFFSRRLFIAPPGCALLLSFLPFKFDCSEPPPPWGVYRVTQEAKKYPFPLFFRRYNWGKKSKHQFAFKFPQNSLEMRSEKIWSIWLLRALRCGKMHFRAFLNILFWSVSLWEAEVPGYFFSRLLNLKFA